VPKKIEFCIEVLSRSTTFRLKIMHKCLYFGHYYDKGMLFVGLILWKSYGDVPFTNDGRRFLLVLIPLCRFC